MIKYTPKASITKTIAHKSRLTGFLGYEDARRILQSLGTVFFTEKKVKHITVGSTQFPVSMFDATTV